MGEFPHKIIGINSEITLKEPIWVMDKEKKREILKRLGKRLGELKEESGLSYRKLAIRCDIDYSDFRKYEKGETDLQFSTIVDMAIALGVHPTQILDFDYGIDFSPPEES